MTGRPNDAHGMSAVPLRHMFSSQRIVAISHVQLPPDDFAPLAAINRRGE